MKPKTTLSWMLRISLAITVGVMLFSPATLHAQVDTGSILGTVTDPSGAVIGNATVTLTNEGTGSTLSTSVGADGGYKFYAGPDRKLQAHRFLPGIPDHRAEKHCGQRGFAPWW